MLGVKRPIKQEKCDYCSSSIVEFMIQDDCAISMCENQKCEYPLNESDGIEKFIVQVGYDCKKRKTLTVANASLETAAANSVKSAKDAFSQGLVLPSTSSSKTQKDQNKNKVNLPQVTQVQNSSKQLQSMPIVGGEKDKENGDCISPISISSDNISISDSNYVDNSSSNNNNNYSLVDIENILNSDDIYIDTESISDSIVQTPKDIIDANLFDGLDGFLVTTDNNTQPKYNPLEGGDSELDSLLGI